MNRNLSTNITNVNFKNNHVVYENFIKCTVKDYEYNYSYNPTLLSGSQGVLTAYSSSVGSNVVYINTGSNTNYGILKDFVTGSDFSPYVGCVGLYNDAGDLLAVAKMAAPMPLSANTDTTFLIKYDTQWENKPYFTPSATPSVTPSVTPSITPTISLTPSPSSTPIDCTLVGQAVYIAPTPSTSPTPTVTPTPSVSVGTSPTPTPSPTPPASSFNLLWEVSGIFGGRLLIDDGVITYVDKSTNGLTQNGSELIPSGTYTISDIWTSGSGNIINCKICWLNSIGDGGELSYLTTTNETSPQTYSFSLPMYMNGYPVIQIYVTLKSGNGSIGTCPVG